MTLKLGLTILKMNDNKKPVIREPTVSDGYEWQRGRDHYLELAATLITIMENNP